MTESASTSTWATFVSKLAAARGKTPQQLDPLSWLTRPRVLIALSTLLLLFGGATIAGTWNQLWQPWIEIVALACACAATFTVVSATRPMRTRHAATTSYLPMALALVAIGLSTVNAVNSSVLIQFWWIPSGVAFIIGTLTPFSSIARTALRGGFLTIAVGVGAYVGFAGGDRPWPPLSTVLIAINATVGATVAAVAVTWVLVTTTQKVLGQQVSTPPPGTETDAEIALRVERRTLARLGTRVAPFLQGIADSGVITAEDRSVAGQMARRLRTDLVGQVNRSWLESVALFGPLYVVDPDHRANQMTSIQRTALRGLLEEIMRDPMTHDGSLLIELRGQPDGSTAVGITVDVDLPEGRRMAMIAPYFLTLQTAVDDLRWDGTKESLNYTMPTPE